MKKYLMLTFLCLSVTIAFMTPSGAVEIILDDYREGLSSKWKEKSFVGQNICEVLQEDNEWCIKITSRSSASAFQYKIKYDPKSHPILTWRWKINRALRKGNAMKKEGDDFAARLFVVFPSVMFWKTKALNYIWANKLPVGKAVPNPHKANTIMIPVESGSTRAGQWIVEKRNVLEDYRKFFGQDPTHVGAIAIMTNTDNTGEEAVAYYGQIRLLSNSDL